MAGNAPIANGSASRHAEVIQRSVSRGSTGMKWGRPMRMVLLAVVVAAITVLIGQFGLTVSSAADRTPAPLQTRAIPASLPVARLRAAEAAFPNCPAPAVNGINVRAEKTDHGSQLKIFVVVQNVGTRAFFASDELANLTVSMNGQSLGVFGLGKLSGGEVKFFSVETTLASDVTPGDIVARLDFGANALIGPVSNTLDCQTSDNAVTRKGQSIRFAAIRG